MQRCHRSERDSLMSKNASFEFQRSITSFNSRQSIKVEITVIVVAEMKGNPQYPSTKMKRGKRKKEKKNKKSLISCALPIRYSVLLYLYTTKALSGFDGHDYHLVQVWHTQR